jgi:hypothetical protein
MPLVSKSRLTSKRGLTALGISVGVVAATIGTAAAQGTPHTGAPAANQPTRNVIVVLHNQHTNLTIQKGRLSARTSADRGDQAPLIAHAKTYGVRNLHGFDSINAFSATVTATQASQLAADPSVAGIFADLPIRKAAAVSADKPVKAAAASGTDPQSGICPSDPAKPLLEPEALQVTNTAFTDPSTPQAQDIVDGSGIKVAFIADGLDINNPDFIRADGSHVFVDYQDFSGDGLAAVTGAAEAFGDASSIASQGRQVYDLADHVNTAHPLPAGCNITVRGMAPGASLIGLKVFGNAPTAPTSRFIEAIDYAVSHGADVLNESFGGNPFPDSGDDPVSLADEAAIAAGVTVVASTGDAGTTGTIGSPASNPNGVIGVAGTTTFRSYLQEDGAGSAGLSNGTWISNNISGLSSGGVTDSGGVPDLAAPGDLGWALCTPDLDLYAECTDDNGNPAPIQNFGGTSMSSPLTAGAAALVIEAYENTHHGVRATPALVKRILTSTATDLGHPAYEQGAGLVNSLAAVKAAESWKDGNGSPAIEGNSLVVDKTQLRLSGNPGNSRPATVTVTNESNTTQTVKGSTRSFANIVSTLDDTADIDATTAPFYIDAFGISRSYVSRTFSVGQVDRLDVSLAANTAPFAGRIILIDPSGAFAAYSIPQGAANYAHIDVRAPTAGTWTAYFALSTSSGFVGTFRYQVVQTDITTHGTVTPSKIVLGPGKSGTFTVHTKVPTSPGDLSASVQFNGSTGGHTSVPMTLRADIPPYHNTFTGTITGGNGRNAPAQSNFYFLNVPSGKSDLSIGVTFQDPNQIVLAYLTAPDGQVYSFQSNLDAGNALQIYQDNPKAGQWKLAFNILNPVSGLEISQQFTARIAYNVVTITASKLPNSASTKLVAGEAVQVPVGIKNVGVTPLVLFADARLNKTGTIPLAELSGNSTTALPVDPAVTLFWLVPTHVTELDSSAVADQPVNQDFFFQSGNPDVYGAAVGNSASVKVTADQVSPGIWATDIGQSGPFNGPAPTGTVTVSASAIGNLFDPAVTATGGDFWQAGVGSASAALSAQVRKSGKNLLSGKPSSKSASAAAAQADGPLVLNPGEIGTIWVTITPSGPSGTVVSGHLYIDSVDLNLDQGNELKDLPYIYTIK